MKRTALLLGLTFLVGSPVLAQTPKPVDGKTIVVVRGLAVDNRVVVSGAALINQIR